MEAMAPGNASLKRNTEFLGATNRRGSSCASARRTKVELVDDFEAVFFDDRIGKHFLGDAVELLLGFVAVPAIEIQHEEFPLADVLDFCVSEATESVLNCLSLRIENGALWHHPDVCFHGLSITSRRVAQREECGIADLSFSPMKA